MEPIPKCAHGASGERGEVVDGREPKLKNIIEQLDVAVLEFETLRANMSETLLVA